MSKTPNEEIVMDGDKSLRFVADFGALSQLDELGYDVNQLFTELSNGEMPIKKIHDILVCTISDVDEAQKSETIINMVNKYGLQEVSIVAQTMMSHAMLGSIKKSQLARRELVSGILDQFLPSPWTNLKRVGLLWVAMCATSTALACLISNL